MLIVAVLIGVGSLWYTDRLVSNIEEQEREKMELWAEATRILSDPDITTGNFTFPLEVIQNNTTIPVIITNARDSILSHRNLDSIRAQRPEYLHRQLETMRNQNDSIVIDLGNSKYQYLYYQNSSILKKLAVYPYIQLGVIILFILVSYIAFSISRKAEQNEVWTGLSKETAHQLGTPISSLLGWIELMKQSEPESSSVTELEKDSRRLERIADRFSKIGSKPTLKPKDIRGIIRGTMDYIKNRATRRIEFEADFPNEPLVAPVNETLFDWVIENLCKNAMDAIQGSGKVTVKAYQNHKEIIIDVADTGRGIPKSKFKTIFKPGYTTKKRGWGLGLSLTKRIVEMYHRGKIMVVSSEPGVQTVVRIVLARATARDEADKS